MADKTKILSNPGTLFIGEKGGELTNVGFTRGGITISKTIDTREIEADQQRTPLYIQTTRESYTINFRLMEITKTNLKNVWAEKGKTGDTSNELSLGVFSENPPEKTILVYSTNKNGEYIIFRFYDCILTSTGGFTFSKNDESLLEATFTALYDDEEGCIGKFEVSSSAPLS